MKTIGCYKDTSLVNFKFLPFPVFFIIYNIARKYMSDIENGKRNVSLDVMKRIADKLGVSLSVLLDKAEKMGE